MQDEEGRLGDMMQIMLGEIGFALTLNHSERYSEFTVGDDSEKDAR